MYTGSTISLKNILWKVKNHPLATDLLYDDAAMYAIEVLELIGTPLIYNKKEQPISITDYKGALPNNMISIRGVVTTDGLVLDPNTGIYNLNGNYDEYRYTYQIEHNIIKTSFEKGNIIVSYLEIATDCDGYPLIPNNVKVKLAVENYILYRFLQPFYDIGKITDKAFGRIEQNKDWYVGAAQSNTLFQSMDHAEMALNSINRLLINNLARNSFYEGLGNKENIKKL